MKNIPDKSDDNPETQAERRARMRLEWSDLIEDLIADGREQGIFDDLPGKGKPLNLKKNIYAPDKDLAHQLLKDNDFTPAWITDRKMLLEQIRVLRDDLGRTWANHKRQYELLPDRRGSLIISWHDACQRWQTQIDDLNKHINDFNLKRPSDNLEIYKLTLDSELKRVGAPRYLKEAF